MSETGEVSKDWLASAEPQTQDEKIVAYIRTAAPVLLTHMALEHLKKVTTIRGLLTRNHPKSL
jgi:hypothetical protein